MTDRSTYAVVDLETTIKTSYKRKANPFDPDNWIVLAGYQRQHDPLPIGVWRKKGEPQQHDWLTFILRNPELKYLVGSNIKFDLLHALRDPVVYAAWQEFVARGGLVWDIQLAEYLLDGMVQSSHMLTLDEMSIRYGGDTKVDEVKKLWEAGVGTEDIPPNLLERYLLGEVLPNGERREGDIGNTKRVFLGQVEKARQMGMARALAVNFGSLCATIEMERNGMFVNKALGLELAADLEKRLQEAQARLQTYLPADLPFTFSWTNRYHLSPLIFGGKIKYPRREYDLKDGRKTWFSPEDKPQAKDLFSYSQKDETCWVCNDGTGERYVPVTQDFPPDDAVRYSSGKNKGEVKTKKVKVDDYTKPKSRMVDCYWDFPGYTQPAEAWASSTEGLYSVSEDVIDALGNRDIPFLKDLASVKKMDKDLGTYFIRYDETKQQHTGMLTLVQDDSIIHHSLNHTSTVTGRFSSSNPNLQNIPKGNKSAVKQVFQSRFGADEGVILQSDFSSLEVYVQAILTACQQLIADLRAGVDMHCMRLSAKEGMPYEEVVKLCKGWVNDLGQEVAAVEEWDYKRTGAKVFSFQRAYGAGNKMISESTGIPLEEVEKLAEAEDARYPEIGAYFKRRTEEIEANRRPTTRFLAHPDNPAITCQLGISRVRTPDGTVYSYSESPSPRYLLKRGILQSFSPTEIKNYEVQGTGGLWMKVAMWLMVREFYRTKNFNGLALLVNTVHDASYADSHNSVRDQVAAVLHACMEGASDFIEWWFNWPLPLPVPSDTVWGKSMAEENKFQDQAFKSASSACRAFLRSTYMDNHKPSYLH